MIEVTDDHGGIHRFTGDSPENETWETEDGTDHLIVKTEDRVACFATGKWVVVIQERPGG